MKNNINYRADGISRKKNDPAIPAYTTLFPRVLYIFDDTEKADEQVLSIERTDGQRPSRQQQQQQQQQRLLILGSRRDGKCCILLESGEK